MKDYFEEIKGYEDIASLRKAGGSPRGLWTVTPGPGRGRSGDGMFTAPESFRGRFDQAFFD